MQSPALLHLEVDSACCLAVGATLELELALCLNMNTDRIREASSEDMPVYYSS